MYNKLANVRKFRLFFGYVTYQCD